MSVTAYGVSAPTGSMENLLAQAGISPVNYGGEVGVLNIQGEGEVAGRIYDDGVEVTVGHDTVRYDLSQFGSVSEVVRIVDYTTRYLMAHQFQFPESVPADHRVGEDVA